MAVFSVEISADSAERLRALDQFHFDLHFRAARQEAPNRFVVPGILTDEQIDAVQAAGYGVQRVADLAQVAAQRAQEVSTQDRFAPLATVAEVAAATAMGYLTVEEVDSAFQTLASAHPDLVQMIELPERTWEDRVCRAVRLRAGAAGERVGVLFTGSIHAREWGGSDILVSLVTRLVDAYVSSTPLVYGGKSFSAEQVKAILERLDLFVFPDVNPDGKQFSQTNDPGSGPQGFWWRKNRNPNNETSGGAVGVDLNRNFDFLWASGIGTSDDPSSFTYKLDLQVFSG